MEENVPGRNMFSLEKKFLLVKKICFGWFVGVWLGVKVCDIW